MSRQVESRKCGKQPDITTHLLSRSSLVWVGHRQNELHVPRLALRQRRSPGIVLDQRTGFAEGRPRGAEAGRDKPQVQAMGQWGAERGYLASGLLAVSGARAMNGRPTM
jgi:hypothetical protein